MSKKRFLAGVVAAVMVTGVMTGCSSVKKSDMGDYSKVVAATYGDENIYLDEVNYYLRNAQYSYEYFGSMYGMDVWTMDGMEDSLREEVMTSIYQTKVLCDYADDYEVALTEDELALVTEKAESILTSDSNKEFLEIAGSNEELLTEILTQNALANKVYYTIASQAEIETTLEDNTQNGVNYLLFAEEPEEPVEGTAYYTEEDANKALEKVQAGTSLSDVAEELEMTASTANYPVNEVPSSDLASAAIALKQGESTVYYSEGTGWYVIYCETENDEEATQSAYDSAVQTEQDEYFSEVYSEMEKPELKVNEDVLKQLDIVGTPVYGIETEEETTGGETAEAETTAAETAEAETTAGETAEAETTAAE